MKIDEPKVTTQRIRGGCSVKGFFRPRGTRRNYRYSLKLRPPMSQSSFPNRLCRKMRGKEISVVILLFIISDFGKPVNQGCGGFVQLLLTYTMNNYDVMPPWAFIHRITPNVIIRVLFTWLSVLLWSMHPYTLLVKGC